MRTKIKFLVMDVDGTMTDGKIYIGPSGEMMKAFNIKDGYAIAHILPNYEIIPVIITGRTSDIVESRARELGIADVYQGFTNKLGCLQEVIEKYSKRDKISYSLRNVCYVGDDIPDLTCMEPIKEAGGLLACPADAIEKICLLADYVSSKNGGEGVIREVIEHLLRK